MPDGSGAPEAVIGDFLRAMGAGMDEPANAASLTALIAQADYDPASRSALMKIVTDVRGALNALLEPAGVSLDADQYARLCGPILVQRFFAREPATGQLVDELVRNWSDTR